MLELSRLRDGSAALEFAPAEQGGTPDNPDTSPAALAFTRQRQDGAALEFVQDTGTQPDPGAGILLAIPAAPAAAFAGTVTLPGALTAQPVAQSDIRAALVLDGAFRPTSPLAECDGAGSIILAGDLVCDVGADPVLAAAGGHDINVYRDPSNTAGGRWALNLPKPAATTSSRWQATNRIRKEGTERWEQAAPAGHSQASSWTRPASHRARMAAAWEQASAIQDSHSYPYRTLAMETQVRLASWQPAGPLRKQQASEYRYPPRLDRRLAHRHDAAPGIMPAPLRDGWQPGTPLIKGWGSLFELAILPPPGSSLIIPPEPPATPVRSATLAFEWLRQSNARLEFVRVGNGEPATFIIPTRSVYLVTDSASIVRTSDGLDIPATRVNLSVDTDSWAWQFSATIPRLAVTALLEDEEVDIYINGHSWRCLVDGWSDSRGWNSQSATITGRSPSAYLSATHMLGRAISEPNSRTMAQLAAQELPVGWTLDWQAADWLIPAGYWSYANKVPIDAISTLATAAGAFIRPDLLAQSLTVLPSYPVAPWELAGATPDIVIPEAIMVTRGRKREPGSNANGVWVTGGTQGITALVKRTGSGADRLAADVTNALITDTIGARALGISTLAKTLPRSLDTIELPISNDTGLILPGQVIETPDGRGYSRAISVAAAVQRQRLTVRQSIELERPL